MLSIDSAGVKNSQKKWVTWSGWDANEPVNGTKPSLFCVNSSGKGVAVLKGDMPVNPFGYSYKTPSNPVMDGGKVFYKNFVQGHVANGSYPVILTNIGNNSFMTFFAESNTHLAGSATEQTGATRKTIAGTNFKFPEATRKELAAYETPQQTASLDLGK